MMMLRWIGRLCLVLGVAGTAFLVALVAGEGWKNGTDDASRTAFAVLYAFVPVSGFSLLMVASALAAHRRLASGAFFALGAAALVYNTTLSNEFSAESKSAEVGAYKARIDEWERKAAALDALRAELGGMPNPEIGEPEVEAARGGVAIAQAAADAAAAAVEANATSVTDECGRRGKNCRALEARRDEILAPAQAAALAALGEAQRALLAAQQQARQSAAYAEKAAAVERAAADLGDKPAGSDPLARAKSLISTLNMLLPFASIDADANAQAVSDALGAFQAVFVETFTAAFLAAAPLLFAVADAIAPRARAAPAGPRLVVDNDAPDVAALISEALVVRRGARVRVADVGNAYAQACARRNVPALAVEEFAQPFAEWVKESGLRLEADAGEVYVRGAALRA